MLLKDFLLLWRQDVHYISDKYIESTEGNYRNTLYEITGGELLGKEYFPPRIDHMFVDRIAIDCTISAPSYPDVDADSNIYMQEALSFDVRTDSTEYVHRNPSGSGYIPPFSMDDMLVNVPTFKKLVARDLAEKWYPPHLYVYEAEKWSKDKSGKQVHGLWFKRVVKLYLKAAELYKKLILELLPIYQPKLRNSIKNILFENIVGRYVRVMRVELSSGLSRDIKEKTALFGIDNVPQCIVDSWIELANEAEAWIAEYNYYARECRIDIYEHNKLINKQKKLKPNYYTDSHPDVRDSWRVESVSKELKEFLQKRTQSLNPPPSPYDVISVRVNPALMYLAKGLQEVSMLASPCLSKAKSDEQVALLDKLQDYKPIYSPPLVVRGNTIDQDIMLQEIQLMKLLDEMQSQDIAELLSATSAGVKLLSLVHMRYRPSLDEKDDASFMRLFKAPSVVDKDNYYKIYARYMEKIFLRCLIPVLERISRNANFYTEEQDAANEAISYLHEFSAAIVNRSDAESRRALTILEKIQDASGITIFEPQRHDSVSYLRQRGSRVLVS